MKHIFGLAILIIFMATPAYADAPLLVVYVQNAKELNSLHITSTVEWNRDGLDDQKRKELQAKEIFYRHPEGNKVVRQYEVSGKDIKVEMAFPKQEQGRGLIDSTRVELSIYEGERLFFHSTRFGQDSAWPTTKPGFMFRPQSLSLYESNGLQLKVAGVYGEPAVHTTGVESQIGFQFNRPIAEITDDAFMNRQAAIMNSSLHNNSNTIPLEFQGRWATELKNCNTNHENNLTISDREIEYWESRGPILAATKKAENELVLIAELSGEGEKWSSFRHYILSDDKSELTDITHLMVKDKPVRVRCP